MNREEYDKLIKFNPVKENCIYCRRFVRETFDFDDVFPAWGSESINSNNFKEKDSYHEECKKEFDNWDETKSEDQLIDDIKAAYQIEIVKREVRIQDDTFENLHNFRFNWYFKENNEVTGLFISEIQTYEVPKQIFKFNFLKHLQFINGHLKEFPKSIEKINNLESLSLSFNTYPINYHEFNIAQQLYFGIDHQRLAFICVCSLKFTNLKSLYLSNINLCTKKNFENFPNLTEINLNKVWSQNLEFKFKNADKIEVIRIQNAQIKNWDYDFSKLKNLKELVIQNSDIKEVPISLCKLKNIFKIVLRNNQSLENYEGVYNSSSELIDKIFQVNGGKEKNKELFKKLLLSSNFDHHYKIKNIIQLMNEDITLDNFRDKMRYNPGSDDYIIEKVKSDIVEVCRNENLSEDQIEKVINLLKDYSGCCWISLEDYIKLVKEEITTSNILDLIWKHGHICIFYSYCPEILDEMLQEKLEMSDSSSSALKDTIFHSNYCETLWDYNENNEINQNDERLLDELQQWVDETDYVTYYWKCKRAHSYIHGEDSLYSTFEYQPGLENYIYPFYLYVNTLLVEEDLSEFNSKDQFEEFVKRDKSEQILENCFIVKSFDNYNEQFELFEYRKNLYDDWEKVLDLLKLNKEERELANVYLYFEPNNELNTLKKILDFIKEPITGKNIYDVIKYSFSSLINRKKIKSIFFSAVKELGGTEKEASQLLFILENLNRRYDLEGIRDFFKKFPKLDDLLELIRLELTVENFFSKFKDYEFYLSYTAKIYNLIGIGCKKLGVSDEEISKILAEEYYGLSDFSSFEELVDFYKKRTSGYFLEHSREEEGRTNQYNYVYHHGDKEVKEKARNGLIQEMNNYGASEKLQKRYFKWNDYVNTTELRKTEEILNYLESITMNNFIEKFLMVEPLRQRSFLRMFEEEIKEELERLKATENEEKQVKWIFDNEDLTIFKGIKDILDYLREEVTIENVYDKYLKYDKSLSFFNYNYDIFKEALRQKEVNEGEERIYIRILRNKELEGYDTLDQVIKGIKTGILNEKNLLDDRRYKLRYIRKLEVILD